MVYQLWASLVPILGFLMRGFDMYQFIKFNIVGLFNTLLDFLIFSLLIWLGIHYFWAQCISYGAGMTNSYALNKYWTFSHRAAPNKRLILRFIALNGASLLMSLALLSWL